jgi:serine protease Do
VIGINTLIMTQGVGQSAGVGFAVPINVAKRILPQLKAKGAVTRGWIGVVIGDLSEEMAATYGLSKTAGAVVNDVTAQGPAEKAGVRPEDIILAVDSTEIKESKDLVDYISSRAPGTVVKLRLLRGKDEKVVSLILGTFPEEGAANESGESRTTRLGMAYRTLTPGLGDQLGLPSRTTGVVVTSVEPGEAADDAGLGRGDVILSVNSHAVETVEAFESAIAAARPNGSARLRVRRGNNTFLAVIKLE